MADYLSGGWPAVLTPAWKADLCAVAPGINPTDIDNLVKVRWGLHASMTTMSDCLAHIHFRPLSSDARSRDPCGCTVQTSESDVPNNLTQR